MKFWVTRSVLYALPIEKIKHTSMGELVEYERTHPPIKVEVSFITWCKEKWEWFMRNFVRA